MTGPVPPLPTAPPQCGGARARPASAVRHLVLDVGLGEALGHVVDLPGGVEERCTTYRSRGAPRIGHVAHLSREHAVAQPLGQPLRGSSAPALVPPAGHVAYLPPPTYR